MTKGRAAGSSLSYPVAQNIAPQDLFGRHYDEYFTEPKSRTPLERLHKTTIKTEMNKDRKEKQQQQKTKQKQKQNTRAHTQRLFNCSCTSDSETYSRVFPNILGNSYNSPRYCCSVFNGNSDCYRSYRKIPKISPGANIFQRFSLRGLYSEGNLRFKTDWAS